MTNGHLACFPSRRGHTWRALSPPIQDHAERVCARCGTRGRINAQGIIVVVAPTGSP